MIICGTAPIVADALYKDPDHHRRVELFTGLRLTNREFIPVDPTVEDYARMAELVERYHDLPLGTSDASVIALAER